MNARGRDLAGELRRQLVDARAVPAALGVAVAPRGTPRQALILCPWHGERTPSCSVRLAKDGTLSVRCHACGASGDVLSLIAQVRGLDVHRDFREVLLAAAELANAPAVVQSLERPRRPEPTPEGVTDETYDRIWSHVLDVCAPIRERAPAAAAYLTSRHVFADAEVAGFFGLPRDAGPLVAGVLGSFERKHLEAAGVIRRGRDGLDWPEWALCIPWRDRFGRITCVQRRRIDDGSPKYRSPRGRAPRAPFGVELLAPTLDELGPEAEVIIVEGAIDTCARRAIVRREAARAAVIGVYSASVPAVGLPLDLFAGRRVVLALDDDAAGDRACSVLAEALGDGPAEVVRERPVGAKDWASALVRAS